MAGGRRHGSPLREKHGPGQRKEAWLKSETGGRALVWKNKGMASSEAGSSALF